MLIRRTRVFFQLLVGKYIHIQDEKLFIKVIKAEFSLYLRLYIEIIKETLVSLDYLTWLTETANVMNLYVNQGDLSLHTPC